ncbi:MAG: hypothetical protein K9N10_12550 [Deltaproteobacteria bacterium]|nr:hypothetical protein [Deltaproteobacteria bacterium]
MLNLAGLMDRQGGRYLIIGVVCLFVWAWSGTRGGAEGKPEMTASLVPNQTSVGGVITLTLKFKLPKGARVAPKPEVKGLDGFQVLDRHMSQDGSKEKEGGEYRIRLLVERLSSGAVGPISLNYATANGKTASVQAARVPHTVLSNLGDKP